MNPITEAAFLDELEKIAAVPGSPGLLRRAGGWLSTAAHPIEVAGLGALAAPSADNMLAKHRARKAGLVDEAGRPTEEGIESKRLIKEKWHDPIEVAGLASLALPSIGHRIHSGQWRTPLEHG